MNILPHLINFLKETWWLTAEMAPYLLLGFTIAGLLRVFFNEEWVRKHLGQRGFKQIIKAVIIGIPLPLCSCGVIPVAAGIRRQGGQRGAVAAFTASTPQTGVDSIAATIGMMGWVFTLVRIGIAFINGIVAGLVVERWGDGPEDKKAKVDSSCCGEDVPTATACCSAEPKSSCCSEEAEATTCCSSEDVDSKEASCCSSENSAEAVCCSTKTEETKSCCHEEAPAETSCCHDAGDAAPSAPDSFQTRLLSGMKFGLVTLPKDLFWALFIGLMLAGAIAAFAPSDLFANLPGGHFGLYLAMTVISLPLYVCSTGSIPMAFSFLQAGMSPGAVLIFLIAGPASNAATVTSLWKLIGGRGTIGYILSIIGTSWLVAIALDFSGLSLLVTEAIHQHDVGVNLFQQVAAGLLVAVLLYSQAGRWRRN